MSAFRLFNFRRFLEACSTSWEPVASVASRAGLRDLGATRQLPRLIGDGLIECEGRCVRLTDAGVLAAVAQSPSYTDLHGR